MLKNDKWIREMALQGMIEPFEPSLVREIEIPCAVTVNSNRDTNLIGGILNKPDYSNATTKKVISYGTSSYGLDIRLSDKDFRVFKHIPGKVVDPKNFNPAHLESVELQEDENGKFFVLSANSYGLGVAVEKLAMPSNITAIALGKSTYARVGVICCVTPAESGWIGHLTLEFSNASSADVRVYAMEGICQLLFLEGEPCETTYADRNGKYQSQSEEVTLAKV